MSPCFQAHARRHWLSHTHAHPHTNTHTYTKVIKVADQIQWEANNSLGMPGLDTASSDGSRGLRDSLAYCFSPSSSLSSLSLFRLSVCFSLALWEAEKQFKEGNFSTFFFIFFQMFSLWLWFRQKLDHVFKRSQSAVVVIIRDFSLTQLCCFKATI